MKALPEFILAWKQEPRGWWWSPGGVGCVEFRTGAAELVATRLAQKDRTFLKYTVADRAFALAYFLIALN